MRRLLIVTLVGLVIGAALINLVEQDPGYVFISLGDVTIETSFWFATVLWLVVWALLSASLAALRTLLRGRQWISDWVVGRKARNAGSPHQSRPYQLYRRSLGASPTAITPGSTIQ